MVDSGLRSTLKSPRSRKELSLLGGSCSRVCSRSSREETLEGGGGDRRGRKAVKDGQMTDSSWGAQLMNGERLGFKR